MASVRNAMRGWHYASTANGIEKNLVLRADLPTPTLPTSRNAAQVLIRTISASLNPADYKVPEISAPIRTALLRLPATPGMDFCGRIVSLTPAAQLPPHSLSAGDIVFGRLDPQQHGTLAEYFPAPAEACTKIPADLAGRVSPDELTCLGVAGLTPYQAIAPHVTPGKGEKVFINGGAGGCGTMAIQIAKALGCHVTVSCSPAKEKLCRRLGADEVIDYRWAGCCGRGCWEGGGIRLRFL
jgi:NADPH:quinone reductase-like Zn-dependent oxidoreductase